MLEKDTNAQPEEAINFKSEFSNMNPELVKILESLI